MSTKKLKVLIVDDEQMVCDVLHEELSEQGYICTTVLSSNDALTKLATEDFDVVLLEIRLPGMSGMEILREIWLNHSDTVTIMITAVNDANTAVEAIKLGTSDYIVKPFDLATINTSISTALENKRVTSKPYSSMEAIALGVEAKLDPRLSYSKTVTQRTIKIARQLGIAEKEIKRWVAAKAAVNSEKRRAIKRGSLD